MSDPNPTVCEIVRLERTAQKLIESVPLYQEHTVYFDLCSPRGRKRAWFLDVYLGIVTFDGLDGFVTVADLENNSSIWAENVRVERKATSDAQ